MIYRNGHPYVPAAANRLTAAGTGACHGGVTIYRDLTAMAPDAFARCGKSKTSAAVKICVVVIDPPATSYQWEARLTLKPPLG
jgi:hypothetical protein